MEVGLKDEIVSELYAVLSGRAEKHEIKIWFSKQMELSEDEHKAVPLINAATDYINKEKNRMEHHLQRIVNPLMAWYATHGRELPWRLDKDPYHVNAARCAKSQ